MFQMCRNSVSCFVAVMLQTGIWNMEPWPEPKVMVTSGPVSITVTTSSLFDII